ncbi:MAG: histidine kinase, partial [Rhodospirillales bacterium]|nr:histidine kinase [Rhodospirillales bacterium]
DDFKSIAQALRQSTGIETWIGTLGLGVVANDKAAFDRPAAAAMILDVASNDYRLITRTPIPDRWPDELMEWAETVCPTSALVHADGTTPALAELIATLSKRSGAYLVGGLTCSRGAQHQLADDLGAGGVSGALFAPDVPVTVGLSQGCSPLGEVHEITGGEGNVITEIDGRSAVEVFKEDIGEILARDLQRVAGYVHVA